MSDNFIQNMLQSRVPTADNGILHKMGFSRNIRIKIPAVRMLMLLSPLHRFNLLALLE